jgi:murein DD-endopeptidase MepM/ murein hydrolase activator NlpD
MMRRQRDRATPVAIVFVAFCAGMVFAWWLQAHGPPTPVTHDVASEVRLKPDAASPVATSAAPDIRLKPDATIPAGSEPVGTSSDIPHRRLRVPIEGADVNSWKGAFYQRRDGRAHEAVDIFAPRNTPVQAVDDGTIAKLFLSKAGGNTIYQFDPNGSLCYYYAHLERYADGLHEGQAVSRGQVIGYVGTSGNAAPDAPHLHFAVNQLNADRHWWQGRALDPYEVFRR